MSLDSSSFSVVATLKVISGARISIQVKRPNVKLISGTNVSLFLAQVSQVGTKKTDTPLI